MTAPSRPDPVRPLHPMRPPVHTFRRAVLPLALLLAVACGGDPGAPPTAPPDPDVEAPAVLPVRGLGLLSGRYTGEVAVRGTTAYTTTWGRQGSRVGDALYVWDVSGAVPVLADSAFVESASTLGDVQLSDDGALLMVAVEHAPFGAIVLFDVTEPRRPRRVATHRSASTSNGVHTAKLARVEGTLYAFLSVNPSPPRLVVLDLSDPARPREVLARTMGDPFVHDVQVRDGILFTALWNAGLTLWDVGGGGRGGTPAAPVALSTVRTVGGSVHNVAWVQLPDGNRRFAWVGEESAAGFVLGRSSAGDVHVVDITDLTRPRAVAFFRAAGAGAHNFAVDEAEGVLYAAFYNGGVRAFDVRGDPGACEAAARAPDGRCDLARSGRELARGLLDQGRAVYVWGVALDGAGSLYASDMLHGIWKLGTLARH